MDLQLAGKRAIVTGGSRGAKAIALAEEGVDLVLAARTQSPLDATVGQIASATGRRVVGIAGDMGDDAAVEVLTARAVEALGAIAIHPGFLRTPTSDAATEQRAKAATSYGRSVGFEEIAALVVMVASPKSAALNGETLQAAGGQRGVIDY
jgi:NAD(P)-dependent dehydrogenase (short-subunit alcohol dehydrogenase family)